MLDEYLRLKAERSKPLFSKDEKAATYELLVVDTIRLCAAEWKQRYGRKKPPWLNGWDGVFVPSELMELESFKALYEAEKEQVNIEKDKRSAKRNAIEIRLDELARRITPAMIQTGAVEDVVVYTASIQQAILLLTGFARDSTQTNPSAYSLCSAKWFVRCAEANGFTGLRIVQLPSGSAEVLCKVLYEFRDVIGRKPELSLVEFVQHCWGNGANPRVYIPMLSHGFEEKHGLDYFGNRRNNAREE